MPLPAVCVLVHMHLVGHRKDLDLGTGRHHEKTEASHKTLLDHRICSFFFYSPHPLTII